MTMYLLNKSLIENFSFYVAFVEKFSFKVLEKTAELFTDVI